MAFCEERCCVAEACRRLVVHLVATGVGQECFELDILGIFVFPERNVQIVARLRVVEGVNQAHPLVALLHVDAEDTCWRRRYLEGIVDLVDID